MGVERADHFIHNHVALSGWSAKGKRWSWQLLHLISQPQGTTFAPQTGTEHFNPSFHNDTCTTSLPPDDICIGGAAPYYSEANTDSPRFTSSIDHLAPVPIKGGDALFLTVKTGMTGLLSTCLKSASLSGLRSGGLSM